jgi:hypothetical protein
MTIVVGVTTPRGSLLLVIDKILIDATEAVLMLFHLPGTKVVLLLRLAQGD